MLHLSLMGFDEEPCGEATRPRTVNRRGSSFSCRVAEVLWLFLKLQCPINVAQFIIDIIKPRVDIIEPHIDVI